MKTITSNDREIPLKRLETLESFIEWVEKSTNNYYYPFKMLNEINKDDGDTVSPKDITTESFSVLSSLEDDHFLENTKGASSLYFDHSDFLTIFSYHPDIKNKLLGVCEQHLINQQNDLLRLTEENKNNNNCLEREKQIVRGLLEKQKKLEQALKEEQRKTIASYSQYTRLELENEQLKHCLIQQGKKRPHNFFSMTHDCLASTKKNLLSNKDKAPQGHSMLTRRKAKHK